MSGYINRLQTMASASLLAEDLGASVHYCWVPFPLVPGAPEDILATSFVEKHFIPTRQAESVTGLSLDEVPRYVGVDPARGTAWLRGHDRGEQALLPELMQLLKTQSGVTTLVIVSGGTFALDDQRSADERRRHWYQSLPLSSEIEARVAAARAEHAEPYLGLHLRYTDRSLQAPADSAIASALESVARDSGLRSLFIASDTADATDRWTERATSLGLEPWSIRPEALDRTDPRSSHGALVDWRLLGSAERLVYFEASSFASEAACAAGARDRSLALKPTALQIRRRQAAAWMEAGSRRLRRAIPGR